MLHSCGPHLAAGDVHDAGLLQHQVRVSAADGGRVPAEEAAQICQYRWGGSSTFWRRCPYFCQRGRGRLGISYFLTRQEMLLWSGQSQARVELGDEGSDFGPALEAPLEDRRQPLTVREDTVDTATHSLPHPCTCMTGWQAGRGVMQGYRLLAQRT